MNTTKKGLIALASVLAVCLFATPAMADYSGDNPLETYEHGLVDGKVMYVTVEDGSTYTKLYAQPKGNLTQEIKINVPNSGTVKMARLYNYYTWSTSDNKNKSVPGVPAEVDLTLTNAATGEAWTRTCVHGYTDAERSNISNPIVYDNGVVQYWDGKGQGYTSKTYDFPSGTFAWDVTDLVTTGHGTYIAKIENNDSTATANEYFVTYGFGLLVVWERPHAEANLEETEYWINEGCDMLYNKTSYETAEDATTSALFDNRTLPVVEKAKLTTVVSTSDKGTWKPPLNMVYFNGNEIGPSTACDYYSIGVDVFNVPEYLQLGSNIAEFQDRGDYEVASNAFLVIKHSDDELY